MTATPANLSAMIGALALLGTTAVANLGESPSNSSETPAPITTAEQIRRLTPTQAAQALPVRLEGVITFFNQPLFSRFLQDETAGIYLEDFDQFPNLQPGDQVLLEGSTGPGEYAPIVIPTRVEITGRGTLPPPKPVSYEDLVSGREDSQWVEARGIVRTVSSDQSDEQTTIEIAAGGGRLSAVLRSNLESLPANLVDSEVRVRGVCSTSFNKQRQLFDIRLLVPRAEDVVVVTPAPEDPFAKETSPIGTLLRFAPHGTYGHRVKVAGTIIHFEPGRTLYIDDGEFGLQVKTRQSTPAKLGDRVEIVGFPAKGEYSPALEDGVWRTMGQGAEPSPTPLRANEALLGLHDNRLVTIEGRLIDIGWHNSETMLVLESDGFLFNAYFNAIEGEPRLTRLKSGSQLRITGVCRVEVGPDWAAGEDWLAKSFSLLLRNRDDVVELTRPPWWTLDRLLWAVGILLVILLLILAWAALLRRKVAQQTTIIHRQLETEAALKERYRDLFENANDMVYTHDLDGRITSVNQAGERLLKKAREDLTNSNLLDHVAKDQRDAASRWLNEIPKGAEPPTVEWDFITSEGKRVRVEISPLVIDKNGKQVEIEGIARDVTEHRRLEKEILDTSAREQRRIGHDLHDGICQQMAGLAFLSDILADKLQEENHPEKDAARKIAERVHKANSQTRSVARGLFPVELEENGLAAALEELAQNTSAFFGAKTEFLCENPVPVQDHTVAHHLYYIAQEAIVNAVKHAKAAQITVRLDPAENDHFTLLVRDNGTGLPEKPTSTAGMGIRIMKYRASMIGATLDIESSPGTGTTVRCVFSAEKGRPPASQPAS